jgi:radical SAM superfamily enzyme YgiQ (UPF0313 family)
MAIVCLVRPLLSPTEFSGYPLNFLILATCLRREGHVVDICDYDYLKEVDPSWREGGFAERAARDVLSRTPQFVGITAMCSNYVLALDFAERLKAMAPAVHVTLGGPHVSLCAAETLERHPYVDTAVIGEGEITYPELIRRLVDGEDPSDVAGIAMRRAGAVIITAPRPLLASLDESPRPAYDLVDVAAYARAASGNYLELYAGSGCPFACSFCSTSIVWERKYRTMPAERLVNEMAWMRSTYGTAAFNLIHDNLTSGKRFVQEIATRIQERGLDIRWGFSSRVDTIDLKTIQTVAAAGCDSIFFGVESASARIQRTMGKRLTLARIHEVIGWCVASGVAPTTAFILGFPDEEPDDITATIRLAFRCRTMGARRSFISLLSPYTGTAVMKRALGGLTFNRASTNSTMISFLEEHHYLTIQADPFLFANYYALDYTGSSLDASEYSDLVDFFTILLFRYPYSVAFLLNELQVDPLAFFRSMRWRMATLGAQERNQLALDLRLADFESHVDAERRGPFAALLSFEQAAWHVSSSKSESLLFSGLVRMGPQGVPEWVGREDREHHYLLSYVGKELRSSEIDPGLSHLYELQGLPAIRVPA